MSDEVSKGQEMMEVGRFLLPRSAPGAIAYFRRSLLAPYSLSSRLVRRLGGSRMRGGDEQPLSPWTSQVISLLGEVPVGEAFEPGVLPFIALRDHDGSERGRMIAFLFRRGGSEPFAVVKLRPREAEGESLNAEAQAHADARSRVSPSLLPTIAEVLSRGEVRNYEYLVLSALPGTPAYVDIQGALWPSRRVERHFEAASSWLAAFHEATALHTRSGQGDFSAVAPSSSHGDFWARNLLVERDGRVGVVDWELYRPEASPFIDLFQFPVTYGLSYPWNKYRRALPETAFAMTFLSRNRVATAVRAYLQEYSRRRRIPSELLRPAFRRFLQTRGTMDEGSRTGRGLEGLPWNRLLQMLDRSGESVFSG